MPVALELSGGRVVARPSPRLVTGSIVAGTVTVDCAGAASVVVTLALGANVTAVVYQNLPTVCLVRWRITQSGGPWTFPASAHPAGTVTDGDYYIYPDATLSRLWWETFDGGATAMLESNAPISGGVTNGDSHDHSGGDGAQIAYSSLSGLPTLGTAAAAATGDFVPASHVAATQAHGISAFGATLVDDADAAAARATLGIGTSISDGSVLSTGLTFPNTGLKLRDTDASNDLTLRWGSNDTANRTLTFTVAGGDRTLTVSNSTCNFTALLHVIGQANGGSSAANKLPYLDGSAAGALADITAAAVTLLAAASAAAQRAIIEAAPPSVVTVGTSVTLTKAAHQGKHLFCTAAVTLTVNASTDFDPHASCSVEADGGIVTFAASSATINRIGSKPLTLPQRGRADLKASATADVYTLTGEMA